jgi:hypothetical protein
MSKHTHRSTKGLHAVGLVGAYCIGASALITGQYWYLLAAPMTAYSFAFSAHFWIEHNTPETFEHPLLSLAGDHVMVWKLLRGEL